MRFQIRRLQHATDGGRMNRRHQRLLNGGQGQAARRPLRQMPAHLGRRPTDQRFNASAGPALKKREDGPTEAHHTRPPLNRCGDSVGTPAPDRSPVLIHFDGDLVNAMPLSTG